MHFFLGALRVKLIKLYFIQLRTYLEQIRSAALSLGHFCTLKNTCIMAKIDLGLIKFRQKLRDVRAFSWSTPILVTLLQRI